MARTISRVVPYTVSCANEPTTSDDDDDDDEFPSIGREIGLRKFFAIVGPREKEHETRERERDMCDALREV